MKVIKPGHFLLEEKDMEAGDDSWAQVELFRWEYGELPGPDDERIIHVDVALKNAAKACLERKLDPFNASKMLKYAGKLLAGKTIGEEVSGN